MARGTLEREAKLDVDEGFVLPALGARELEARVLESTYFDSPEGRLRFAGITLRRRVENGRSVWHLKLPRKDGRLELEAEGGPLVPAELTTPLRAVLAGRELGPVLTMRTRRRPYLVGDDVAEIALDEVTVLEGGRADGRFLELEVELHGGDADDLRKLVKALRRAGARPGDGRNKLERALSAEAVAPAAPETALEVVAAALSEQLRALLAHDPGARLGGDLEDVHQLRVATRRARAYLRAARPVLDEAWSEPLRGELQRLGRALGPVRDLDVLKAHLEREIEALGEPDAAAAAPLLRRLRAERRRLQRRLVAELDSDAHQALLQHLDQAPRGNGADASLESIAARELRKVRKRGRAAGPDAADEELHALRIQVKRARYAAELLGPAGEAVVERAKEVQDVLGEHQDAVVAEQRLRELAEGAELPVGRLIEREQARRRGARAGFDKPLKKLLQEATT